MVVARLVDGFDEAAGAGRVGTVELKDSRERDTVSLGGDGIRGVTRNGGGNDTKRRLIDGYRNRVQFALYDS